MGIERSLLHKQEIHNIYGLYEKLGISEARIAHVRHAAGNFGNLRTGNIDPFHSSLYPGFVPFEIKEEYLDLIQWAGSLMAGLSLDLQRTLEAGAHLHDIGYGISSGGDHPEAGYLLLRGETIPEGFSLETEVWDLLNFTSIIDRTLAEKIVRYHELYSNIGYLFPVEILRNLTSDEKTCLLIMNLLDSTAFPTHDGFRSKLSSRLIKWVKGLFESERYDIAQRYRHLFGPTDYIWLNDKDSEKLGKLIDAEVKGRDGFGLILEKARFLCWPLLKDMVTPDIVLTPEYYTSVNEQYLRAFVKFLIVISQVAEKLEDANEIFIDVHPNYFPKIEYRKQALAILRESLTGDVGLISAREAVYPYSSFYSYNKISFGVIKGARGNYRIRLKFEGLDDRMLS